MAVNSNQYALTTTPQKVAGGTRGSVIFYAGANCYLGGPDVTASNGYLLTANAIWSSDVAASDDIYVRTVSGTATGYRVTLKGV